MESFVPEANLKTAIVVTTIFTPGQAISALSDMAKQENALFVIAGDKKTPSAYGSFPCEYLSTDHQDKAFPSLSQSLPFNHYSRKNVGYLHAIRSGVKRIVETDDDNIPRADYLSRKETNIAALVSEGSGWINVYKYFSAENIWPRGYPIESLSAPHSPLGTPRSVFAPIQQGLADENPDVDAIYRMTGKLPISFDKVGNIALSKGAWCPFNSQNTTWFEQAFPLLYLPSFCSFRMTDIWRSFIAQRILWECDANLVFHDATVWQERNEHNLLKDFNDEVPGYLNNEKIRKTLEDLSLLSGWGNSGENLVRCYNALISLGFIGQDETRPLHSWLKELEHA